MKNQNNLEMKNKTNQLNKKNNIMKNKEKNTVTTNGNLTPLQLQWKEMLIRQIGKPIGITVYNPNLKKYVSPLHNENSIKHLLKVIPSDEVILQYIQKSQNNLNQ